MSTFKKIATQLTLAILLLTLWACGGKSSDDTRNSARAQAVSPEALYRAELAKAQALANKEGSKLQGLERLAKLYHANGEQSKAMQLYEELLAKAPQRADIAHLLASLLAGFGQLEEAAKRQTQAVENADQKRLPLLRLGEIQLKLNRFEQAEKAFQQAFEISNQDPYALLGLARCDLERGDWRSAQERLEQSVANDPSFQAGWSLLTTVLDQSGQTELAQIARKRSFTRNRKFSDPWLEEIDQYCFDPYQLSVAAAATQNRSAAKNLLQKAIELSPNSSSYLLQLGKLYQSEGNKALAKDFFGRAIEITPDDSESWAALIHLLMEEQNYQELAKAIDEASIACPDSGYVHYANGKRYAMIGLYDQALAKFESAKKLQPNEARSYIQISMIQLMMGKLPEAKAEALAALEIEPSSSDATVMLAKIAIANRQLSEARKRIGELRDLANHSPEDLQILVAEFQQTFRQNP